jgi:hypothetical protein
MAVLGSRVHEESSSKMLHAYAIGRPSRLGAAAVAGVLRVSVSPPNTDHPEMSG